MKDTPITEKWPTRDSKEDARGLPGRPEDARSGITGGKPDAEKQPSRTVDTRSAEDDNLGAD